MGFIYNIAASTISNILSVVVIAAAGYIVFIIKRSIQKNFYRRFFHPSTRVLHSNVNEINGVIKLGETRFKSGLSKEQRQLFIDLYNNRTSSELYNDPAIRIDDVDENKNISISLVGFFDFAATNLTVFDSNAPVASLRNMLDTIVRYFKMFDASTEFKNRILLRIGKNPTFKKVLDIKELANIATVNILIEDKNGDVALVKRSKKDAVSSGNFSVVVGGTPNGSDYQADDPFLEGARRSVRKELKITQIDLQFQKLIISRQKMQPVFLYKGKLDKPWSYYLNMIAGFEGFTDEKLYVVPQKSVMEFVKKTTMSDESAYQLWLYSCEKNGKDMWTKPWFQLRWLERFCRIKNRKVLCGRRYGQKSNSDN